MTWLTLRRWSVWSGPRWKGDSVFLVEYNMIDSVMGCDKRQSIKFRLSRNLRRAWNDDSQTNNFNGLYVQPELTMLIIIILNYHEVTHSPTTLNEPAVSNPPGSNVRKRQDNGVPAREQWMPADLETPWRGDDSSQTFRADHATFGFGVWTIEQKKKKITKILCKIYFCG